MIYKSDCEHFRGDVPCKPHKISGVHCDNCESYSPKNGIVLIIKLGAIGDVIRTTPLIAKLKKERPGKLIWWLTYSPDVVPGSVHKVFKFNEETLLVLKATKFDTIYNLDKDPHACALTNLLESDDKIGFVLKDGKPAPANSRSDAKFLTGLFDDVNKANEKSYLEEMFEICGYKFQGEEYEMEVDKSIQWDIPSQGKRIIGLNTGCGSRWVSRLWPEEYWVQLIEELIKKGSYPVLLGGEQEHEKNLRLAEKTGALYLGYFSLAKFISLCDQCDTIVTAVTMGLHIAVALKKTVILMNNIFNPKEFELYGRGAIVQPDKVCTCFFSPECKNDNYFCLESLKPEKLLKEIYK